MELQFLLEKKEELTQVIKTKTVTEWGVNYVSEQYMNLD
jgi:hypothetical protein